jgi:hypothetical protein
MVVKTIAFVYFHRQLTNVKKERKHIVGKVKTALIMYQNLIKRSLQIPAKDIL